MDFIKSLNAITMLAVALSTALLSVNEAQSGTLYKVCTEDKESLVNVRQYARIDSAVIDTVRSSEPFITTKIVDQDYKGNLWEFGFFKVFYNVDTGRIDNLTSGWISRDLLCPVE